MQTTSAGEWFGGEFFRNKHDGKVYIGNGKRRTSLSQVTGLDSMQRLPTCSLNFTPELLAAAEQMQSRRGSAGKKENWVVIRRLAKKPASLPLALGGFSWGDVNSASWRYDQRRAAEATWTFDDQCLHVAFRNVGDGTPMVNGGNLVSRLFKTGDAAVFEMRITPNNRVSGVLPGDFRLLFSVFQGQPVVVLYRYKALPGEELASEIFSMTVTTRVEVVKVLEDARIAIDRRADGYDLRAAIRLADLGLKPEAGKGYRGDFGIIHSDVQGQVNDLRMHWANKVTGLVDDLGGEAAIKPANWGNFSVTDKR